MFKHMLITKPGLLGPSIAPGGIQQAVGGQVNETISLVVYILQIIMVIAIIITLGGYLMKRSDEEANLKPWLISLAVAILVFLAVSSWQLWLVI